MSSRRVGIIAAVVSSMLSSLAWVFQGEAVNGLTPLVVASGQGLLTGVFYLLYLLISRSAFPRELVIKHARDLTEYVLLRGVIGSILVCFALSLSDSIKVMFLTKLEPYFIIFWVWILQGKGVSRSNGALLLVHVIGAILLSTGGAINLNGAYWGDLLLVIGIALFAFCYLHAGRLSSEMGAIHLNGVTSISSGVILLPIALAFAPVSNWNPLTHGWRDLLIVVILFDVFAISLWYHSMRTLEGWLVSALRAVGPVCAAPLAWYFFGQTLGPVQIGGAGLVIITSALLARSKRPSTPT